MWHISLEGTRGSLHGLEVKTNTSDTRNDSDGCIALFFLMGSTVRKKQTQKTEQEIEELKWTSWIYHLLTIWLCQVVEDIEVQFPLLKN